MLPTVQIKGTKEGLLILLGPGLWDAVLSELTEKLDANPDFFRGARVALSTGNRELSRDDILRAGKIFSDRGMFLWAVLSDSEETAEIARKLGLETEMGLSMASRLLPPAEVLVVEKTLRSGQELEHRGSVILIGDVNPGARITASEHIIVWGRLRGDAHAGYPDREDAVVAVLGMEAESVAIGSIPAVMEKRGGTRWRGKNLRPTLARVEDGKVVFREWKRAGG
jgi:septum site-determining protein MinC